MMFLSKAFLTIVALILSCLPEHSIAQELIHYWNFNDVATSAEILIPTETIGGASLEHIQGSSSSAVEVGTGQNFNVDNLNARNEDESGSHLRFNNPIGGVLLFSLPTTGYETPIVRFSTRRSGQGAGEQHWYYSTDNGDNYTLIATIEVQNANPELIALDFSGIPATYDNPGFMLRVEFEQGLGGTEGNNRFDNFTLDAVQIGLPPEITVSTNTLTIFNQTIGFPSLPNSFTVSGSGLLDDITITTPSNFELSLEEDANYTNLIILPNSHGLVENTTIFVRLNANTIGLSNGTIGLSSEDAETQIIEIQGETTALPYTLLYYWHFNDFETIDDVIEVDADYSLLEDFTGKFTYTDPQEGQRDIDSYSPGSEQNYHMGQLPGSAARVRNPSADRSLIFDVPTNGAEDIVFTFSVQRSNNGMLSNTIEYSIDGESFISLGELGTVEIENAESWTLFNFDFSGIDAINDNPNFKIRITWEDENALNSSGNNRYDNITLSGKLLDLPAGISTYYMPEVTMYPNPANEEITLQSTDAIEELFFFSSTGAMVAHHVYNPSTTVSCNVQNLDDGMYILLIKSATGYTQHKLIKK